MYGIYALVNLFSPNSLARCTRSFVLRKQINACVNTIRQHFPLRNLHLLLGMIFENFLTGVNVAIVKLIFCKMKKRGIVVWKLIAALNP